MASPAVQKAREAAARTNPEWEALSTGYMARLLPVGASLIDEVVAGIADPPVPMFLNPDKGREEENPLDPTYQIALEQVARQRAIAAMETMLLFGVELQEVPDPATWLPKIKLLEKRGRLDLSGYDLDEPLELELLFKKFIAVGSQDLIAIGRRTGLNSRDVEEAARTFQDHP